MPRFLRDLRICADISVRDVFNSLQNVHLEVGAFDAQRKVECRSSAGEVLVNLSGGFREHGSLVLIHGFEVLIGKIKRCHSSRSVLRHADASYKGQERVDIKPCHTAPRVSNRFKDVPGRSLSPISANRCMGRIVDYGSPHSGTYDNLCQSSHRHTGVPCRMVHGEASRRLLSRSQSRIAFGHSSHRPVT